MGYPVRIDTKALAYLFLGKPDDPAVHSEAIRDISVLLVVHASYDRKKMEWKIRREKLLETTALRLQYPYPPT